LCDVCRVAVTDCFKLEVFSTFIVRRERKGRRKGKGGEGRKKMGRGNKGLLLRDKVERRGKGKWEKGKERGKGGKETALPMKKSSRTPCCSFINYPLNSTQFAQTRQYIAICVLYI